MEEMRPRPPEHSASPFVLDALPPSCGLEVQARGDSIRFRAQREDAACSEWSGWFPLRDCPIVLAWRSFWPDGEA